MAAKMPDGIRLKTMEALSKVEGVIVVEDS